jgi:glucokinase
LKIMATPEASAKYIGVDVSGTTFYAALVGADAQVLERREEALERDNVAAQAARAVTGLRDAGGGVAGIGVGVTGLVDPRTNRVIVSTDVPSLARSDLRAELSRAAGLEVLIENDANAAAYGEFVAGAGRGSRNLFYATIGTGVGGALILDGRLWRGESGFAGEFGHITIDPDGAQCSCGNTGCLETVASAPNIVRRTQERLRRDGTSSLSRLGLKRDFDASDVAHAAREGDDFALMMLERTGRHIGQGLAAVINLLNIERIVLGGVIMEAGQLLLDPVIREAGRRSFQPCFESTQIVAASLARDAVTVGAAMLARDAGKNGG